MVIRCTAARLIHRRHVSRLAAVPTTNVWRPYRPQGSATARLLSNSTPSYEYKPNLPHDLGGSTANYAPINISNPDALQDWEVNCHSLFAVLAIEGAMSTDGLRRAIESLTPSQYEKWGYYEKWAAGIATLLLENGIIAREELGGALFGNTSEQNRSGKPLYDTGDYVRVRSFRDRNSIEWRRPHIRVPGYIYGAQGIVERVCGEHEDPSFLAFGLQAPKVRLYRVRFEMRDVWPENYADDNADVIEVEVYEPWLDKSEVASGRDYDAGLFDHKHHGSDFNHTHEHHHDHHDNEHGDHSHDPRPSVEERAVSLEGEPRPGKELYNALIKILTAKGIITYGQVREMAEKLAMAGKTLNGASLVARAWVDPSFEERLLKDAPSAAAEIGIATSNPNAPTVLTVVKNTDTIHNLIVCTLCSCYPSGLLGIAPSWYKSREYRARAVREPREVLHEFGTRVPNDCQIRVHDSTADHRYLVLPKRPDGTNDWAEDALKAIVTRDSMVGVSVPRLPL